MSAALKTLQLPGHGLADGVGGCSVGIPPTWRVECSGNSAHVETRARTSGDRPQPREAQREIFEETVARSGLVGARLSRVISVALHKCVKVGAWRCGYVRGIGCYLKA